MTEFADFQFDDIPRLNFFEEALGCHRLERDDVKPYHAEAVLIAGRLCTERIVKRYSGSVEYTQAISKTITYRDGIAMGLGLSAGPESVLDDRMVEIVELGLFKDNDDEPQFVILAELREDYVKTGGMMKPRINDPQDLDSFMRGLRYISQQLT
jgi:hypothetical protein